MLNMISLSSNVLKYAPLVIGISILAIGAFFVPWREVLLYFSRLGASSYLSIFLLGAAHYMARIFRYHYMLGVLNAPQSLRQTTLAYFIAQPISLLPAGEMYRIFTLKEHLNVPTTKGASVVFIQSFTENLSLVVLALLSAVYLNQNVLIVLGVVLLYIVVLVFVRSRRAADKSRRLVNKVPFINLAKSKLLPVINKNKTLLSGKSLIVLFLSGFVSSLLAIVILFIVANDLQVELNFTESTIVYALPTVLQNLSFLPGGIGINEQGTVGILVIFGSSLPAAVALTLIMRFVTLVLGVIIGLFSLLVTKKIDANE